MQTSVNELKGERSKIWDLYQLYENTHTTHVNITGIDVVVSTVWYVIEWLQSDPILII